MIKITDRIKVVFWDLDDTLWRGTLAEKDEITLYENRVDIIRELNKRGIVSSICSKNDFETAKSVLVSLGIWDLFVFPRISFESKGEIIKDTLSDMGLRATNALFVDDNVMNLNEVAYYNPEINLMIADSVEALLDYAEVKGKDDSSLSRYKQYKVLEEKTEFRKKSSSNEAFLRDSNICLEYIDYDDSLLDRLYELTERTNQLNFTKNRMSKDELVEMISSGVDVKLIHVTDSYGDYGVIGYYALKDNELIHFVFSCRIMNMGIEQFVYGQLGFPELTIVGEVATEVDKDKPIPNYIQVVSNETQSSDDSIEHILTEDSKLNIFAIGACDLYHPIAHFSMPNQHFVYECNVFNGSERGVNVGTEYIRSHFDMTDEEKDYCKKHFFNYNGTLAFNSQMFARDWDYAIMSFHDDMIYKTYRHKENPNIRVVLSPEKIFGLTSVIDVGDGSTYPIDDAKQKEWLAENFEPGEYISEDRFYDNLKWIQAKYPDSTKIILITGPELDFFRDTLPHCPEAREQIIKLNRVLFRLQEEMPDRFAVVDINNCIQSKADVTNYIFHLTAQTSYDLFSEIVCTMIMKFPSTKKSMLWKVVGNRDVLIFGNTSEAINAYFNLYLGGNPASGFIHRVYEGLTIGDMPIENWEQVIGRQNDFFVVIADSRAHEPIKQLLEIVGYEPLRDFVNLKEIGYTKVWNEK